MSIAAGYDLTNTAIFTGVVVSQGIEINQHTSSKLVVEITDKAMAMTLDRKNAVFANVTDSSLMTTLIGNYSLNSSVSSTSTTYEDIVQYYATDWDLLVMRAELNGFVVIADSGKVTVAQPETSAEPVLLVAYGDSILDLDAQMNAATQFTSSAIKSSAWDDATQKVLESGPSSVDVTVPGNVSSEELAKTFDIQTLAQQSAGLIPTDGLQDWSTAELLKSRLSKIRGQVRFQGSALARTGCMIELGGLGDRFNGSAFVSGVYHKITGGRWTTTATFGLAYAWFASEAANVAAPPAGGQLPPIQGLQTGIVQQVATDDAGEYRVKITLPLLGESCDGVWARLGTFYASNQFGAVFFPEVADEVVVGFMNNDPRYPVILGSVYSKTLPPSNPPNESNDIKAIVTRSKLQITFDDANKILTISTPGKRVICLDDNAGKITVSDDFKNSITMSSDGITIDSSKDLVLKAAASVTVTAGTTLSMTAAQDSSLSAMGISNTATGSFQAQGATASLEASGITSISGAMVNIN